jgi:DNA-directed RNA polymerase II subunit RPB1
MLSRVYYDPDDWNTRVEEDSELVEAFRVFASDDPEAAAACPWVIRLQLDREALLNNGLTMLDVSDAVNNFYKDTVCTMHSDDNSSQLVFRVRVRPQGGGDMLTEIRAFEAAMMESVTLKGNMGIRTAMPLRLQGAKEYEFDGALGKFSRVSTEDEWILECDGRDLTEVLASPLVDSRRTQSNDVCETLHVLGVEAAHRKMFEELQEVFKDRDINPRHLLLLVDTMALGGGLQSINRHGINRGDIGPLAKCSFEETTEMLAYAAMFADVDRVNGVSASIMLGQVPPGGTGEVDPLLDESLLVDSVLVDHPLPTDEDHARVDRDEICRRIMRFAPIDMEVDDGWNAEHLMQITVARRIS